MIATTRLVIFVSKINTRSLISIILISRVYVFFFFLILFSPQSIETGLIPRFNNECVPDACLYALEFEP